MKAYMKLYEMIRGSILDGVYRFGDRLPSKRQLAESTGTSVITAEHAYNLLMEEGYAEARERSGYYVIYREGEAFGSGKRIPFSAPAVRREEIEQRDRTERELFPFSAFAKTMREVLTDYGEKILLPSPHRGMGELREAISSYLARSRNLFVSPEQILIGSGAEYFYGLNIQVLGRDRIYALEDPSYDKIRKVYQAHEAAVELLPLGPEGIRSEALEASHASVLHVTPVASYPTGITASASKRAEYIGWAKSRGGYLIEDDFDSEFTVLSKPENTLFSLWPEGNVIYMNSFSRTIAPSIRAAYLVLPRKLLPVYEEKAGFYSCTVPVFDQLVLAAFIRKGLFERHINRVRRSRRKALREAEKNSRNLSGENEKSRKRI